MQWARRQHQTRRYRKIFKTTIFAGFISVLLVTIFAAAFGVKKVEAAGATQTATWKSNTVIVQNQLAYSDAGNKQTLNGTQAKVFEAKDKAGCVYQIYFPTNADLTKVKTAKYVDQVYTTQASGGAVPNFGCFGRVEGAVTLTNTQSSAAPSTAVGNYNGSSTPATATTSSSSDAGTIDSCNADGGNLSWVICPFVDMIGVATKGMQNIIDKMMMVDMTNTFDKDHQDTAKAYYAAWNSFRIFGIALIVIAGLVMVISQALGMELFDAYTVKKVLPRLLVAVIGISLSWWLMQFLAGFTNDVGIGIRSVIYSPFKDLIPGSGIQSLGSSLIEALIGGAAILFLGIGGIFSLLLTAGLAALVAFLVLVVRQIVITFLILLAPIAIACYVLPNTEKAYKLWWDSLSKGLMMFPIISAFIATGQMFAVVANSNTNSNFGISNVVAILAYFMPYFALPFTFRLAGGAIATLGGLTNDRSRGVFDMLKNKRKAIASDRLTRAQNQSLWDNNSRIGRRANKVATWVTDPVSNAALTKIGRNTPGLKKRGANIATAIEHARVEQTGKLFEEINKMGFNDKGLRALSGMHYGMSEPVRKELRDANLYGKAPQSLKDITTMAEIMEKHGNATEKIGGGALRASAGRLATLYQDAEMTKASVAGAGIMGLAAHGFASSRDLTNAANMLSGAKQVSHEVQETDEDGALVFNDDGTAKMVDIGNYSDFTEGGKISEEKAMEKAQEQAGFAGALIGQAQLMGSRSRPEAKNGYGVMYDGHGRFIDGMTEEGGRMGAVLDTFVSHDLATAKGGAIKAVKPEIIRRIRGESGPEIRRAQMDQLFSWAGPYSQASADVKAEAIKIINKESERDPQFAADWQRYSRMEDPEVRRVSGAGDAPEPPGGGGGGPH